ncbi:MAG: hypothetical protein ACI3Y0_13190 [Prevotella sp.]
MNKREYAQANKDWLVNKAQEEGQLYADHIDGKRSYMDIIM